MGICHYLQQLSCSKMPHIQPAVQHESSPGVAGTVSKQAVVTGNQLVLSLIYPALMSIPTPQQPGEAHCYSYKPAPSSVN